MWQKIIKKCINVCIHICGQGAWVGSEVVEKRRYEAKQVFGILILGKIS